MAFPLPLNTNLANAERRIRDAANMLEKTLLGVVTSPETQRAVRAEVLAYEREAREFYAKAEKSGWVGDVDAQIAEHWAVHLPQVSAAAIWQLRAKALAEATGMTGGEFRAARLAAGLLTTRECAAALETNLRNVQRWESGEVPVPGPARVALRLMQPAPGQRSVAQPPVAPAPELELPEP